MIQISFPWPHKDLSPNQKKHWAVKARHIKKYRAACHLIALGDLKKIRKIKPEIDITFEPPDARKRDMDNRIAQIKPLLDGVADALGVDDSTFKLRNITMGQPHRPYGRVIVEITPDDHT